MERSFHERELQQCRTENEAKIKAFETQLGDFRTVLVETISKLERDKTDFISDVDIKIINKLNTLEKSMEGNFRAYESLNSFMQKETLSDSDYAQIKARQVHVPP